MQYSRITLPGFNSPIRNFQRGGENNKDLEEYIAKFIMSKVIITVKNNGSVGKAEGLSDLDISFVEGAARGEKPYKEFWDKYVKDFLMQHGKKTDPNDYLQTYKVYNTNFPRSVKDYLSFVFYSPQDNLKITPTIKKLVDEIEENGAIFDNFNGEIKSYPKSQLRLIIRDLEKSIESSNDEVEKDQLQDIIVQLTQFNASKKGEGFKKDVPIRLSIKDIEDIDGENIPELSLYTMITNIPADEELTPKIIKREYLGDEDHYPEGTIAQNISKLVKQLLLVAKKRGKELNIEIARGRRFNNVDTPETVYRVNFKNPPVPGEVTLVKAAQKHQQNISADDYVKFLKDPKSSEDLQLDAVPDDLEQIKFGGDKPVEISKKIFLKHTTKGVKDDENVFKNAIQDADDVDKKNIDRNDLDVLWKAVPEDAQTSKIWIDGAVAEAIKSQSIQALRKYFATDAQGNVVMRKHDRGTKHRGLGLRYEHVVPMKVLGELGVALYSNMKQSGNFDDVQFKKQAEEIITSLYTVAWVDVGITDVQLDRTNLKDRMGTKWEKEIRPKVLDGALSIGDQKFIRDAVWGRYNNAGIDVNKFVRLDSIFTGESITLDKVTKQQLAPKVDDTEQYDLREGISLVDLLNDSN